jgi:hypothetical protein
MTMSHDDVFTINFQANRQLYDDLHALARSEDRSASAVIRLALRAWLKEPRPAVQSQQENGFA